MGEDHRPPQPQKVLEDLFPDTKQIPIVSMPHPLASVSDDELERFALKARWAVSPIEDTDGDTMAAVAIGFVREVLPQIMKRFSELRTRGAG